MGYMPYTVEVGPALSALTHHCNNKDIGELLTDLRESKNTLPDLLKKVRAPQDVIDHVAEHWFGYKRTSPTSPWESQPNFDPNNPRSTGWWTAWYGDAEGVVRRTMIRAIEVALGLGPD